MTLRYRLVLANRTLDLPAEGALALGSEEGSDIVLRGAGVDPRHARLECHADGVRVIDLASRNGTKVNDRFVSREELRADDCISIGVHVLTLAAATPSEEPAVPTSSLLEINLPLADVPGAETTPARPATRRRRYRSSRARAVVSAAASPSPSAPRAAPAPAAPVAPNPSARSKPVEAPLVASPRPVAVRAPNGGKRSGALVALAAIGVLIVVAVVVILLSSGDDREEAVALLARAESLLVDGHEADAEVALLRVQSGWPGSPEAARARERLEGLHVAREREVTAAREIGRIWAEREMLGREDLLEMFATVRGQLEGTQAYATFGSFEAKVGGYFKKVERDHFARARKDSDEALEAGDFRGALDAWRRYAALPARVPRSRLATQAEVERIHEAMDALLTKASREAAVLAAEQEFGQALGILVRAERRLIGTPAAGRAREEADRIRAARSAARGETVAEAPKTPESEKAVDAFRRAEMLAQDRRYLEAAELYRKGLETIVTTSEARGELVDRLAELADLAVLMGELREQIASSPDRFTGFRLGDGVEARVVAMDDEGVDLAIPKGSSRIGWRRMSQTRFLELASRLKLDGPGLVALGRLCFLAGEPERAHAVLADASEAEAPMERVFAVLASARGMPVPADGFVVHRRRWYTPAERDEVVLRERIADLARRAASQDRRRSDEALAELRTLGEPAREALVEALRGRLESLKAKLFSTAAGNAALVPSLVRDLGVARKSALSLIHDAKRYPYDRGSANPYGPDGEKVQKEVDDLVAKVVAIWEDPLGYMADKWPALREAIEALAAIDTEIAELTGSEPELPAVLAAARDKVGLAAAADGGTHEKSLEVVAANAKVEDSVVNEQERDCVRAVNEYRRMMGLRAVRINPALVQASRQHSAEMAELNYFAHDSPVPENRTPGMRARNAEYKGGGVTENIARGATTGRGAHVQWCHSSGHHRNVLGRGHTEVGVGQAQESWWTQMFGRGSGK